MEVRAFQGARTITRRRFWKTSHREKVFSPKRFKTPLPVKGFSPPFSLWLVFQNPSPCDGFHSLKCSDLDFKKNGEFLNAEAQFWNASGALFRIDFSAAVLLSLSKYVCMHVWRHTYPGFARRINNVVQRMRVKNYVPCRGKSLSEVSTWRLPYLIEIPKHWIN